MYHGDEKLEHCSNVVSAIRQRLSSPAEMTLLFERCPAGILGETLVRVFDALRDDEITQVSLEGARNGYFLAATLSWLLPEETVCSVGDNVVFGRPGAPLAIRLVDKERWYVGQWKQELQLEPITVQSEGPVSSLNFSSTPHTPLETARASIAAHPGLASEALDEGTGVLAATLINVAYRKGLLYSNTCDSTEKLSAICSTNFRTSHGDATRRYG
jgi:hypothetical protein